MSKKRFTDEKAIFFLKWQYTQRDRENMPGYCIKTLDRVKKNAKKLNRQVNGSKSYNETLFKLHADKEKFFRQLKSARNAAPEGKDAEENQQNGTMKVI